MAWLVRGDRRYYYRSRRVNGRTVHRYVGTGTKADQAAAEDAQRREEGRAKQQAGMALRSSLKEADKAVAGLTAFAGLMAKATLLATGFHQHDRGVWRRRKG